MSRSISQITLEDARQILNSYGEEIKESSGRLYIKCFYHDEKTPSMEVFQGNQTEYKVKFKCYGCNTNGDLIDYLQVKHSMTMLEAKKALNLEISEREGTVEFERNLVMEHIGKKNKHNNLDKVELYSFLDKEGSPLYHKAKQHYLDVERQQYIYRVENKKVYPKLSGIEQVPYNLHRLEKAKKIIIVEGEKDCETVSKWGYTATSFKGVRIENQEKYYELFKDKEVFICGDTGDSGEKYSNNLCKVLEPYTKKIGIVNLPMLHLIGDGDNKDVTDWRETFHKKKKDFDLALKSTLDRKNIKELQQDHLGIYYRNEKLDQDGNIAKPIRITNFSIVRSTLICNMGKEKQQLEIVLRPQYMKDSSKDETRIIELNDLNNVQNFNKALKSDKFTYLGQSNTILRFKSWLRKYFTEGNEVHIHPGKELMLNTYTETIPGEYIYITPGGAFDHKGNLHPQVKCEDTLHLTDMGTHERILKNELKELMINLTNYLPSKKNNTWLGWMAHSCFLAHSVQLEGLTVKQPILHVPSLKGSGKTQLALMTQHFYNEKNNFVPGIGGGTAFTFLTDISKGNTPITYDEWRPSQWAKERTDAIVGLLLESAIQGFHKRGDYQKESEMRIYKITRPMMICGEETYPSEHQDALNDRTLFLVLTKQFTSKDDKSVVEYLTRNSNLLSKLGHTLRLLALNTSLEQYKTYRATVQNEIHEILSHDNITLTSRQRDNLVSCGVGIHLLNTLLEANEIPIIEGHLQNIVDNMCQVLQTNDTSKMDNIARLFIQVDELIGTNEIFPRIFFEKDGSLYVHLKSMMDGLKKYKRSTCDNELHIMSTQALKQQGVEYIGKDKRARLNGKNPLTFTMVNIEKIKELNLENILAQANILV